MDSARFEIFTGKDSKWYWHLKAANGEIVASSEAYSSKDAAESGIAAVKRGVLAAVAAGVEPR